MAIGADLGRRRCGEFALDPDEAVNICQRLGAESTFVDHWGTFRLTEKPMARLSAASHRLDERAHSRMSGGADLH